MLGCRDGSSATEKLLNGDEQPSGRYAAAMNAAPLATAATSSSSSLRDCRAVGKSTTAVHLVTRLGQAVRAARLISEVQPDHPLNVGGELHLLLVQPPVRSSFW